MERLERCPLCNSKNINSYHEGIKDYAVSKELFSLSQCENCNVIFTNPRPDSSEITPYYNFDEYYSHSDESNDIISLIYQKVKNHNIQGKIEGYHELSPRKGRLLDYGCGTAELITQASHQSWEVFGIEPNAKALSIAKTKLGDRVFSNLAELPTELDFDIISLFHVMEHIHDLQETMANLVSRLKKGAHLIIAIPNPGSPDAEQYQEFWAGWDLPRHLYHFTENSMQQFGKLMKLELLSTKPMKFDSYYVSLLSESYQNPKQSKLAQYIKAFSSGLKSNIKAKRSSSLYSSNIFIFRKP